MSELQANTPGTDKKLLQIAGKLYEPGLTNMTKR